MKKFAFINIPSQELERPPAAAALLSSVVRSAGWDCKVFDFNFFLNKNVTTQTWNILESFWRCKTLKLPKNIKQELENTFEKFYEQLKEYNPDWLGLSVFSRFSTLPCYEFLKYFRPKIKATVIIGGHGISAWPGSLPYMSNNKKHKIIADLLKAENLIDHYILGDGEDSLIELLNENIDYPGLNGQQPIMVKDLDNVPLPSYTDIEPLNYYYTNEPGVYVTASKGCVRKCTFCNVPDLWPKFSIRSNESLMAEITKNKKQYGVNLVHFTDSLINGSMKHFRQLNKSLIELKQKDSTMNPVKYMGQFICRTKNEQTENDWELMAKAGAHLLVTGFESYSPNVRKHMGKNYSNDDIAFHFKQSAYYGIRNVALMFIGYPVETLEDHEYNKEFLYKYQKYAKAGIIHMVRWGYTGMFRDTKKVEKPGNVEMAIDPDFESRFKNLPQGVRDIALGMGWINKLNPTLTLNERIRRRLELHELSVKLGWPQTRSREELEILYNILDNLNRNKIVSEDFEELENLLDFH